MLEIVPITRKEAQSYVEQHHRHLGKVTGAVFQLAVAKDGGICGVAISGRPISPVHDDGWTLEVNRCCTDGTRNATSKLYSACWRVARNLGYKRLITYTHKAESGDSLRGAGWKVVGEVNKNVLWHNRPVVDTTPFQQKLRWEIQ